ncbi:hypothetical protein Ppa06_09570 [Planomonospora parontospora subsp. parontospora]|uniref:Uncharacterized protein n=3 Tax=Planomonospora parontospora TaxID=58119 RepID=A0AA37BC60_9ACTN|nr:hypothetical protein GCM10010126_07040 [Planomonospora parontospora]GII07159.1 hypothetical protein Ppa06_09570 [Planomonospora parontospora subsp. parontospora]
MTSRKKFDQWSYFEGRGLEDGFECSWVEAPDYRALVTALRVEETLACDLNQAWRWYLPYSDEHVVWVAEQSPGWVKLFTVSGLFPWRALESLPQPGGRAYHLLCFAGEVSEPVYVNGGEWEDIPEDHWDRPRQEGAGLVGSSDLAQEMNFYLAALAYTTGRFVDDTWFTTPGLLCRIPEGAWPRG